LKVDTTIIERLRTRAGRAAWLRFKRARQHWAVRVLGSRQRHTLFVAGVQRSGTNMVMDLLEQDMSTMVFHETDRRAFKDYELRPIDCLSQLVDETAAPVTVFKALCECQDISVLLDSFVGSRCVWVYRHYEKVAASHVVKWTQMPETIRRLIADDGDTHGWRGRGLSEATRSALQACYHDQLNNESACALFWYMRNQLYFEQSLAADPRVALLNYEQLLSMPHESTAGLYEFAGLAYRSRAADMISSPASGKKRKPLSIDPAVRALCDDLFERLVSARQLRPATAPMGR